MQSPKTSSDFDQHLLTNEHLMKHDFLGYPQAHPIPASLQKGVLQEQAPPHELIRSPI